MFNNFFFQCLINLLCNVVLSWSSRDVETWRLTIPFRDTTNIFVMLNGALLPAYVTCLLYSPVTVNRRFKTNYLCHQGRCRSRNSRWYIQGLDRTGFWTKQHELGECNNGEGIFVPKRPGGGRVTVRNTTGHAKRLKPGFREAITRCEYADWQRSGNGLHVFEGSSLTFTLICLQHQTH